MILVGVGRVSMVSGDGRGFWGLLYDGRFAPSRRLWLGVYQGISIVPRKPLL